MSHVTPLIEKEKQTQISMLHASTLTFNKYFFLVYPLLVCSEVKLVENTLGIVNKGVKKTRK